MNVADASGDDNIILTGFMGTGKSTVGRVLATLIDYAFVDTDEIIEQRHGAIAAIFRERGEDAFRAIEQGVAEELAAHVRTVIATGGRMMLDSSNIDALSRRGHIFCLVATPGEILARVTADDERASRPLLAGGDTERMIIDLLADRREGYERFEPIGTDGRSPAAVADEIATRWRREASSPAPAHDDR